MPYADKEKQKEVMREYYRNYRKNNVEKERLRKLEWRRKNPEKVKAQKQEYYENNKDQYHQSSKRWQEKNPKHYTHLRIEWKKKNRGKVRATNAKHKLKRKNRVPAWLTESHIAQIQAFYIEARNKTLETGIQYHVDHIVPLNGRNVSGLHVPWNLRVIKASINVRKSNKHES